MILYKYRAFNNFEHLIDILVNERLYCPIYKDMNDPFEGLFYTTLNLNAGLVGSVANLGFGMPAKKIYKSIEDLYTDLEKTRVCSLSSSLNDVRLWSHYGGAHGGVAIAIDFTGIENQVSKVEYTEGLPELGSTILTMPYPSEVLSYKTTHWEYEKEYRIINSKEYFPIKGRIKEVFTGPKIEENRFDMIKKILNKKIPLVRTTINKDTVTVEP